MALKKGDFVRHPSEKVNEDWGLGIVLDDEYNNVVSAYFENSLEQKKIKADIIQLVLVDEPGDSALFLQNAIYKNKHDRMPFSLVLDTFLARFPGGLNGQLYLSEERDYKLNAHLFAKEFLAKDRMEELIAQSDWDLLSTDIKRSYGKTNLLASFEMIKMNDAFKDADSLAFLCRAFYELLHGDETVYQRIEAAEKAFARFEMDKWPVITHPLFVFFPEQYMFVKPTMIREAADKRGFDIQYSSQVNGSTYERVLMFSKDLFERLKGDSRVELHPRDMIDVQGFMWCTFAGGWTDEDISKAMEKLALVES